MHLSPLPFDLCSVLEKRGLSSWKNHIRINWKGLDGHFEGIKINRFSDIRYIV